MKKKILLSLLVLCLGMLMVGCSSKDKTNDNEVLKQPTVEGAYEAKVLNLRFFIPSEMTVNSYNGFNNTFNYYIENNGDNCDLTVILKSLESYNNSLDKFIKEYALLDNYKKEKINNATWYFGINASNKTVYITALDDYFCQITLTISQNGTICSTVNELLKTTLFLVK